MLIYIQYIDVVCCSSAAVDADRGRGSGRSRSRSNGSDSGSGRAVDALNVLYIK